VRGGIRFGVGPLAHLLKNRFYLGEPHVRCRVPQLRPGARRTTVHSYPTTSSQCNPLGGR
jgi:hypothetical protein